MITSACQEQQREIAILFLFSVHLLEMRVQWQVDGQGLGGGRPPTVCWHDLQGWGPLRSPQSILLNLEHSRELLAWPISSDGTSGLDLPPQLSGGLFSFSTELQTLLLPSCVFSLSEYLFVFCSSPDQLFPHSSGWRLFIPKDGSSFQATLFQSWTVEYCSLNFATCTIQIQLVCF